MQTELEKKKSQKKSHFFARHSPETGAQQSKAIALTYSMWCKHRLSSVHSFSREPSFPSLLHQCIINDACFFGIGYSAELTGSAACVAWAGSIARLDKQLVMGTYMVITSPRNNLKLAGKIARAQVCDRSNCVAKAHSP